MRLSFIAAMVALVASSAWAADELEGIIIYRNCKIDGLASREIEPGKIAGGMICEGKHVGFVTSNQDQKLLVTSALIGGLSVSVIALVNPKSDTGRRILRDIEIETTSK